MNEQNFQYLKDQLKYLGFGENLNETLANEMELGSPVFSITYKAEINRKSFEAALHFRRPEASDLYFLNSYAASLIRRNGEKMEQLFYLSNGKGVTAKEAYNLLEGRAVFKELSNKNGEKYHAWLQIDFENKDKRNNHEIKLYHEQYGFDLRASVSKFALAELRDPDKEKALLRSLERGNMQMVTIEKDGFAYKMFLEANPQYKMVNLYDADIKRVQKEEMRTYQVQLPSGISKNEEPEQSQDQSKGEKQEVRTGLNVPGQGRGRSNKKSGSI